MRRNQKITETCEMCSVPVQNPVTIKIEGALLRVCSKCSQFGHIVEEKRPIKTRTSITRKPTVQKKPIRRQSGSFYKKDKNEKILIAGYGEIIREARMKKKLTQEQLAAKSGVSVPQIRSIEAEKIRPTDNALHKLERVLSVELFYTPEAELEFQESSDTRKTTLGDIAIIERYEWKKDK